MKLFSYYSPYVDQKWFWELVDSDGILNVLRLILGGDLNLTMPNREVWGNSGRQGVLDQYFNNLFANARLIEVEPSLLCPTLRNGHCGVVGV